MNPTGIKFEGGSGDSIDDPIIIKQAENHAAGVSAEYRYLEERFGKKDLHWRLISQALLRGVEPVDRLTIELADGSRQHIFFDTSEFFGKL
jgi:hypothetical protein